MPSSGHTLQRCSKKVGKVQELLGMVKEIDKICPEEGQKESQSINPNTQNMIRLIVTE
jgi:hypothetical protein